MKQKRIAIDETRLSGLTKVRWELADPEMRENAVFFAQDIATILGEPGDWEKHLLTSLLHLEAAKKIVSRYNARQSSQTLE